VYAAYNAITAPKEIAVLPFSGHTTNTAHHERQLAAFTAALS
jgi:cephalosporin-C deacetylase